MKQIIIMVLILVLLTNLVSANQTNITQNTTVITIEGINPMIGSELIHNIISVNNQTIFKDSGIVKRMNIQINITGENYTIDNKLKNYIVWQEPEKSEVIIPESIEESIEKKEQVTESKSKKLLEMFLPLFLIIAFICISWLIIEVFKFFTTEKTPESVAEQMLKDGFEEEEVNKKYQEMVERMVNE